MAALGLKEVVLNKPFLEADIELVGHVLRDPIGKLLKKKYQIY